jgi:ABC-type Fe3+-siderophore transport system permease subunit
LTTQNLLRNPLASPFTLGISQGAAFGAAFSIVVLGAAVASDIMPGAEEMRRLFDGAGLDIAFITDDHLGYFLSASRKR